MLPDHPSQPVQDEPELAAAPSQGLRPSPYRWVSLGTLMAGLFPNQMTILSLGILLPSIRASLVLTPLQAGWLGSAPGLANAIFSIPFSWWLSRYNPRRLTSIVLLSETIFIFSHGLAPNYPLLLGSRTLYGMVHTACAPAQVLLVQQWFPLRQIPLVTGIMEGVWGVGEASALALTPLILIWVGGWRNTYFFFGLLGLLGALGWLILGRENLSAGYQARLSEQRGMLLRNVLRYRELWLVVPGLCGGVIAWLAFATFWPLYMGQTYAFPLTLSGVIFGLISLGQVPSGLLVGFLSSRTGKRRIFLWAAGLMMTISSVGMLLTDIPWLLVVLATIGGFSWGFGPIMASIPYQLPHIKPREVAVASAFMSTIGALAGALGPVLAGALYQGFGSLFWALLIVSFFPLAITFAGFVVRDELKKP